MPEVILPCPECGSTDILTISGHISSFRWWVRCNGCGRQGSCCKTEEDAIAAWNAMPRSLTWTTEPPKVAGKYWWSDKRHPDEASIINVTKTKLDGYLRNPIGEYEQFAGPIAPPIE